MVFWKVRGEDSRQNPGIQIRERSKAMDREFLQELLPEASEETLTALLEQHHQALEAAAAQTQALRQEKEEMERRGAVEKALTGLEFTSLAAKNALLQRLESLTVENGSFSGLEECLSRFRQEDPGALETGKPRLHLPRGEQKERLEPGPLRKAFGLR